MNKRVFIFSNTALWDGHYAEAVEIALKRRAGGDSVFFYQCRGELLGCPANPYREKAGCVSCIDKSTYVIENFLSFAEVVTFDRWSEQKLPKAISEFVPESKEDLESMSLDGFPIGGLVASQLANDLNDGLFDPRSLQNRVASLLETGYRLFSSAKHLFLERRIDLAYVWNGRRASDGPVVFAAKDSKLEFQTFISGPTLGTYIEPKSITVQAIDYQKAGLLRLKDDATKNFGVRDLVTRDGNAFHNNQKAGSNHGLGVHNFSSKFSDRFLALSTKPVLSIFPSCGWEKIGQQDFRNGVYDSEYQGLESLLSNAAITSEFEVVVRWHPHLQKVRGNEKKRIQKIQKKFEERTRFIAPSNSTSTYSLIENSELVLTFGSTVGVEACYYGKPSICVGPAVYDCLDVAYFPKTPGEVEDAILNYRRLEIGNFMDALVFGAFMKDLDSIGFEFLRLSDRNFFLGDSPVSMPMKPTQLGWKALHKLRRLIRRLGLWAKG